jgi:hypothetical protein
MHIKIYTCTRAGVSTRRRAKSQFAVSGPYCVAFLYDFSRQTMEILRFSRARFVRSRFRCSSRPFPRAQTARTQTHQRTPNQKVHRYRRFLRSDR